MERGAPIDEGGRQTADNTSSEARLRTGRQAARHPTQRDINLRNRAFRREVNRATDEGS